MIKQCWIMSLTKTQCTSEYKIEGSGPEWHISSRLYFQELPFWPRTLKMGLILGTKLWGTSCRTTANSRLPSSHRPEDLARPSHRTQKKKWKALTMHMSRSVWVFVVWLWMIVYEVSVSCVLYSTTAVSCRHSSDWQVADQTCYLAQSQYTGTVLTSSSTDPIPYGARQGSHCCTNTHATDRTWSGKPGIDPQVSRFPDRHRTTRPPSWYGCSSSVFPAVSGVHHFVWDFCVCDRFLIQA